MLILRPAEAEPSARLSRLSRCWRSNLHRVGGLARKRSNGGSTYRRAGMGRATDPRRLEAMKAYLAWDIARHDHTLGQGPAPGPEPDLLGFWYLPLAIEDRVNALSIAMDTGKRVRTTLRRWRDLAPEDRDAQLGLELVWMDRAYRDGKASAIWLDRYLEADLRAVLPSHVDWPNVLAALARWYWKAGSADNVDRLVSEILSITPDLSAVNPIMREVVADIARAIDRDIGLTIVDIDPMDYSAVLDGVSTLMQPLCIDQAEMWRANVYLHRVGELDIEEHQRALMLSEALDDPAWQPSQTLIAWARAEIGTDLFKRGELDKARRQFGLAHMAARRPLDASWEAAEVCVRCGRLEVANGDEEGYAALWAERAMTPLIVLRDLTIDPVVRGRLHVNGFVAARLARLLFDVGEVDLLHQFLAAIGNHGLVSCIDPEPHAGLLRPMSFLGEATRSIQVQRTTFDTRWVNVVETTDSLAEGEGLIQLHMFGEGRNPSVIGVYADSARYDTFRTRLDQREVSMLTDVSRRAMSFRRDADWQQLSYLLLPDEILTGDWLPSRLVFSASGALSSLPFARLPVDGRPLGERLIISTIPEVGVWPLLDVGVPAGRRAVVLGVDAAHNGRTGIVGLAEEIATLRQHWQEVDVVTNWPALAVALRSPADLLVLGVHGDLDGGEVHVLLLPDGALVRSEMLADLALPETVIATACWSGRGLAGANPFGLVRPTFIGGARSVVVSLWDVESTATSEVLQTFYGLLRSSGSVAEALCRAQRSMPVTHHGSRWGLAAVSR